MIVLNIFLILNTKVLLRINISHILVITLDTVRSSQIRGAKSGPPAIIPGHPTTTVQGR